MAQPAERLATVAALRLELEQRFREAIPDSAPRDGLALGCGIAAIDALLPHGGLRPGETATVDAREGAGRTSLLSSWARTAALAGEEVAVVDASAEAAPHAFVEPEGARAGIWTITPAREQVWAALDLLLRSGAFGLILVMGAPRALRDIGSRLAALARDRRCRLVFAGAAPMRPQVQLALRLRGIDWQEAPIGAMPRARRIEARVGERCVELSLERSDGTRLRLAPPGPDRRAAQRNATRSRSGRGKR